MNTIRLAAANIVTAFDLFTVGSKVTDPTSFMEVACRAIEAFDFEGQREPGQGFVMCGEAVPFVSAGVGRKTLNPADYLHREYRGEVTSFLRREKAATVEGCALIVYTLKAYLADPDITPEEAARVTRLNPTHVLVAVLAFAGPKAPLSPYRLAHNLAGGNNEAAKWTADEIRAKAAESLAYDREWSSVAD